MFANAANKEIRLQANLRHEIYRATLSMATPSKDLIPLAQQNGESSTFERPADFQGTASNASASASPLATQTETLPEPELLSNFLTPDQLTSQATPVGIVDLAAPPSTEPLNSGTLVLKLWIDRTGRVIRTDIEKTDFSPAYSDTVAHAFSSTAFSPGQVNGLPVNSIVRIETSYE
jgi:hypothetical protein